MILSKSIPWLLSSKIKIRKQASNGVGIHIVSYTFNIGRFQTRQLVNARVIALVQIVKARRASVGHALQ